MKRSMNITCGMVHTLDNMSARVSTNYKSSNRISKTYYCLQQSCGKVIFSEVCVKNSVHKGGGIPACIACLQAHSQGASWGVWPGGISRPTHRGKLRGLAWGVSMPTPGGSPGPHLRVSQHALSALRQTPPADGYCCGWYASYWNAFLLHF